MVRKASVGEPVRVCFVCIGNITRSPMAEAVLRDHAREDGLLPSIDIDSAATSGWHIGEAADPRAVEVATRHGVHIAHRARQFGRGDFDAFDLVVVMDLENRTEVLRLARHGDHAAKVRLLRTFDPAAEGAIEIDDPAYGSPEDFERVFAQIESSCEGLLAHLRAEYLDLA